MEETLDRLIDIVQSTAPELFRIAKQQVMAEIVMNIVSLVIALALIITAVILVVTRIRKYSKPVEKHHYDSNDVYYEKQEWTDTDSVIAVVSTMAGVVASIIFLAVLSNTIIIAMAPEYRAIQILVNLIK
jgi:uncharacterized membrane protein YhaH (DUF805 family)